MARCQGRRLAPSAPHRRRGRHRGRRELAPPHWRRPVMLALSLILLVSGWLWSRDMYRSYRERSAYKTLAQKVHKTDLPALPLPTGEGEVEPSPYEALAQENPDLAGWLTIEGTAVDYPVMWTPDDPEYYLRRAFDQTYAVSGSLFIGAACAPDATHVIIYGHNMNDGSMFGSLSEYASADYAVAHPTIRFDTLDCSGEYRVLAAFYSHAYFPDEEGFRYYRYTDLSRREDFEDYVLKARASALYDTGIQAEYGDRLLTLSTCSYHQEYGTFVVVAVAPAPSEER